jgi:hypothetical protein
MESSRKDGGVMEAEWKPDCCGKQSCDNEAVSVDLRYYPRGGGFFTLSDGSNELKGDETRPHIPPSVTGVVWLGEDRMIEAEFDAETEAEVKALADAWAKEQLQRVVKAVKAEFEKVAK